MAADGVTELLEQLEQLPLQLGKAFGRLEPALARHRSGENFAPIEHAWHLADLEQQGFGERIRRLLEEDEPELPDFDGARAAREGDYLNRSLYEGMFGFAAARAANLVRLRALAPAQWRREGLLEGVGRLRLADLPARMLEHDEDHRSQVLAWYRDMDLPAPWSS